MPTRLPMLIALALLAPLTAHAQAGSELGSPVQPRAFVPSGHAEPIPQAPPVSLVDPEIIELDEPREHRSPARPRALHRGEPPPRGAAGGRSDDGALRRATPTGRRDAGRARRRGNLIELFTHLSEVGNDPWLYSSRRVPTLVFDDVQFSGT